MLGFVKPVLLEPWKGQRCVLWTYLGMRYVTGGGVLAFPMNQDCNGQREARVEEGVLDDLPMFPSPPSRNEAAAPAAAPAASSAEAAPGGNDDEMMVVDLGGMVTTWTLESLIVLTVASIGIIKMFGMSLHRMTCAWKLVLTVVLSLRVLRE